MIENAAHADALAFGPFSLFPSERRLERDGVAVQVGSRALDILVALADRAGEVVTHRELMGRVWPNMVVDESSLRVHMAGLRKALGNEGGIEKYIRNIPGRGYSLVAPLRQIEAHAEPYIPSSSASTTSRVARLPASLKRMLGRDDIIAALATRVLEQRFVTVVAPGGMGKTSVAVYAAHRLVPDFDGAVYFVDFSSISDPGLIANTIASVIGLTIESGDPASSLIATMLPRRALLVLDNCEHLIDGIAPLAERLFVETEGLYLLATSREAMRIEGEQVYRLPPLETPRQIDNLSAEEALKYPAIQLFVERAAAGGLLTELSDADAPVVARICRNLDGLALAIELAAGRVNAYGFQGTAELLENRFRLDWQGRRTALPRHKTLAAMLDWSYQLLPETEQVVLRQLSVFSGFFNIESIRAVATVPEPALAQAIVGLIEKSLLSRIVDGEAVSYRLLENTRVYAAAKLSETGEQDAACRSLTRFLTHELAHISAEEEGPEEKDEIFRITPHIANLRKALEWSFSAAGDKLLGVKLVAAAVPLLLEASLFADCACWSATALGLLDPEDRGTKAELPLLEGYATSLLYTAGNRDEVLQAIDRAIALAGDLKDYAAMLRVLPALPVLRVRWGELDKAMDSALQIEAAGQRLGSPMGHTMADNLVGISYHLIGNQPLAIRASESGIARGVKLRFASANVFAWGARVHVIATLSRALWIQGRPSEAVVRAHQSLREGAEGSRPFKRCMSIIYSTHVFLWIGDYAKAEELIDDLLYQAERHGFVSYHAAAVGMRGELLLRKNAVNEAVELLNAAIEAMTRQRYFILQPGLKAALAEGYSALGQHELALQNVQEAVSRIEATGNSHDYPEIMRIHAATLANAEGGYSLEAEAMLLEALRRTRAQGDLGWELRVTRTLAGVLEKDGRSGRALSMLKQVYDRFTDGHETLDLQLAQKDIARLGCAHGS